MWFADAVEQAEVFFLQLCMSPFEESSELKYFHVITFGPGPFIKISKLARFA